MDGGEFTGTTPLTGGATASESQKSLDFIIPNAYYTRTTSDGYIAYGVGIFSPFGLGQEYENKNTSIFRNQITMIDLQTVVVNPTIAFKINEYLSVGAGIDYMWGKAKLEKTPVATVGNLYNSTLESDWGLDGDAWGYNFGVLLKPTENFRIGANYRSPFTLKIKDADVTISNTNPAYASGLLGATPSSTKGSATVAMPATFALGAAYTIGKLTVEADADWTFWSSFQQSPDHHPESGSDALQYQQPETMGRRRRFPPRGGVPGDRPAFLAGGLRLRPDPGPRIHDGAGASGLEQVRLHARRGVQDRGVDDRPCRYVHRQEGPNGVQHPV